ncbi:MAG: ComEA family DNA-binding protein [Chloroflexi bacterium]|nr:ComEA family DNA-binding protein [Chloroflexota bacterium]
MKGLAGVGLAVLALAGCGQAAPPPSVVSIASSAPPAATPTAAELEVYVTGAVARPGVYSLNAGSRIQDAIGAAGGFVDGADMVRVNLAEKLRDEEEIYVPRAGEAVPALPAGKNGIDINTASATQLRDALSISSTLASKIVSYRRQHGPFRGIDDLRQVPVPDADIQRIRGLISLT